MIAFSCICILVTGLLMARVSYNMGVRDTHRLVDEMRVKNIQTAHKAWRVGMLAERMRAELGQPVDRKFQ